MTRPYPDETSQPAPEEWVSKTRKKQQMNDLQDLGLRLTRLSNEVLNKMNLGEDLHQAVLMHKKITSNSALKRQTQYIGRLMREIDPAPIEAFLARLDGEDAQHNALLHRIENQRSALLADDAALTELMERYPHADVGQLRTTIRNARREREAGKPPKAFRALFQQLRSLMDPGLSGTATGEADPAAEDAEDA